MRSGHVLLVEDDKDYADLTTDVLRDAGFRVTTTEGREAALRVIEDGVDPVNLVISDVMMGYLSEGFDLARSLRNDPQTRDIPIVLLTGVREIYDVVTEIGENWYPCDAFLEKPVEAQDLVTTVCALLKTEAPHSSRPDGAIGESEMATLEDAVVNVLVVEDDPDYAALLASMLQDDGYCARTARDGAYALEEVRAQRPDVITLDLQMPRKSGVLFYRQLKSDPEFREIPVVIVSGITRDDRDTEIFVHALLEVEHLPVPSAYLEKPVEPEQLLGVVRTALRTSRAPRYRPDGGADHLPVTSARS